MNKIQQEGK